MSLFKKRLYLLTFALLFLYLPCAPALAQEAEQEQPFLVYSLGQQTLSLSAGLFIPLFFQSFDGAYSATNLKLGGAGSLQWAVHLSNNWMVGIDVGGIFSKDINDISFFMLPITAKGSYIIHFFPFEFPIFIGTGINMVKYSNDLNITWIVKPGFSSISKYNFNWGFGLNVVYWWVLQPWPQDPSLGRMGNFLEITATVQYNFSR